MVAHTACLDSISRTAQQSHLEVPNPASNLVARHNESFAPFGLTAELPDSGAIVFVNIDSLVDRPFHEFFPVAKPFVAAIKVLVLVDVHEVAHRVDVGRAAGDDP